jgi:hypothetical protein
MRRHAVAGLLLMLPAAAFAASLREPAPPGSFRGAPAQYTRFTSAELTRGFLALAFGSDFLIGARPKGIRRYDHPITARIVSGGHPDRSAAMTRIIEEYARRVPNLHLSLVSGDAPADIEVRLIDERNFRPSLESAFGTRVARRFMARTNAICMTSVRSDADGAIAHSTTFVIVDQGDKIFLDCAYHEMLHALGLPNHDQHNPWTTLNQRRMVGYLGVYDHALVTLLYDRRIRPGMTAGEVGAALPAIIADLGLAAAPRRR